MKSRIFWKPTMAVAVMALCSQIAPVLLAQTSNQAPASEARTVQLSSGVQEILKLGRGKVGDEVIIAFIVNSGKIYHLSASEILYLREQGVSDQVLTAMLSAGQNVATTAAQAAPQPVANPAPTGPTADWVNSSPQPAPAATQFAPAYVAAAAPVYVQPSPVYVYPAPSYGYYDSSPYTTGAIPRCRSISDSGAVIMAATTGEAFTAAATTVAVAGTDNRPLGRPGVTAYFFGPAGLPSPSARRRLWSQCRL
jgi:hypothetical protein